MWNSCAEFFWPADCREGQKLTLKQRLKDEGNCDKNAGNETGNSADPCPRFHPRTGYSHFIRNEYHPGVLSIGQGAAGVSKI